MKRNSLVQNKKSWILNNKKNACNVFFLFFFLLFFFFILNIVKHYLIWTFLPVNPLTLGQICSDCLNFILITCMQCKYLFHQPCVVCQRWGQWWQVADLSIIQLPLKHIIGIQNMLFYKPCTLCDNRRIFFIGLLS